MDQSLVGHPVTLIIKAPNQKYTDQTINCFLDWTVGKLKTHLSSVYPSKPNSEHSGSTTPSPTSQESLSTSINSISDGVRHRNLPQAQSNPVQSHQFPYLMQGNIDNQFPGQGVSTGFPMYPAFSPLQMIWWQQMYARQYYMQYQAAVSAQATSSTEPVISAVAQPVNSEHVPVNEPPAVPNVAAQENRPVNQNVQMNAQGGPVVNEEDFNRDWLDWMYTFSRAAILLSIVYFYSSFSRFVMVMGAMLLVYLHQAGWFPFRQEGGQQQAANNNAEVNRDGQNVNNPDLEEMERLMDDGIDEESGEDAGEDGSTEQNPGFMASAWSFITTFFTSLIPEGPPQVGN
ncbi:homocysteine-responsive endoplasmic reticulum-resident ubiquitin-like domain member 2 protein isoform X3 [Gopherus flavomarginatus]|uniref:homocysteine-responsive endoplasmic reticulum-resident ubiquitin-like domain member 2 protein isoform X3 n=1 Tax=Gopherus flavomarginatus TaxID=286002 RepID=UPI0021CC3B9D|nr:homocysteine-responsive endoplasmic reticulum-resident ubiquitin-like domain member 2 protein isoform X3 [Gopherus flavomarginatus]